MIACATMLGCVGFCLSVGWLIVHLVVSMEPWLTWNSVYGQVDLELVAILLPLSMSARIMGLSHHSQLF